MARVLFAVRAVVAVVVASVVLGFLIAPGSARPTDNRALTAARGVVEGMAAFGRGVVDLAVSAIPDDTTR